MGNCSEKDILVEKCLQPHLVNVAKLVLNRHDQSEEEFLGAQMVLLMNGQL